MWKYRAVKFFQYIFLAFFIFLFFYNVDKNALEGVPELFFYLDPLNNIVGFIITHKLDIFVVVSLFILLFTIFFGRLYCSGFCPLGAVFDLFSDKRRYTKRLNIGWIKYVLLLFIIAGAVLGSNLYGYFSPFSIFYRFLAFLFYPFLWILFNLPNSFDVLSLLGIRDILSPYFLDVKAHVYWGGVLGGGFFLIIFFLSTYYVPRFWCRYICPLGALLSLFSRFSFLSRRVSSRCYGCGLCQKECPMDAISNDYLSTDKAECIMCFACEPVCRDSITTFSFFDKEEGERNFSKYKTTRREFLWGISAGIFGGLLFKYNDEKRENIIRPPGVSDEEDFISKCIRCGECMKVCPTGGLEPLGLEFGLKNLWTPHLNANKGYCDFYCIACTEVCPVEAIPEFKGIDEKDKLKKKQGFKMGLAYFVKDLCIPWSRGSNCITCQEACPTKAIEVDKKGNLLLPYVVEDKCIGCGICVYVCPVYGKPGIELKKVDKV